MKIGLIGQIDKRPILYPLVKLFHTLGDTAVFSTNLHLTRLTDGKEIGYLNNCLIVSTNLTVDEVFPEIGNTEEDFDHIIYDISNDIPDNLDIAIYCKGMVESESERMILDCVDSYITINFGFSKPLKDEYVIEVDNKLIHDIERVESLKLFDAVNNSKVNKVISEIFASRLDTSVKNVSNILSRRWK